MEEPAAESPEPDHYEDEGEVELLQIELEEARVENLGLHQQVKWQKTCLKKLWCTNCQCLAEYDAVSRTHSGSLLDKASRGRSTKQQWGVFTHMLTLVAML